MCRDIGGVLQPRHPRLRHLPTAHPGRESQRGPRYHGLLGTCCSCCGRLGICCYDTRVVRVIVCMYFSNQYLPSRFHHRFSHYYTVGSLRHHPDQIRGDLRAGIRAVADLPRLLLPHVPRHGILRRLPQPHVPARPPLHLRSVITPLSDTRFPVPTIFQLAMH